MKNKGLKNILYNLLQREDKTSEQLRLELGFPQLEDIKKRLVDLENEGLIRQSGKFITTPENKTYVYYRRTPLDKVTEEKEKRHFERKYVWIVQGRSNGYISPCIANLLIKYLKICLTVSDLFKIVKKGFLKRL
jgi:hypothetical protein